MDRVKKHQIGAVLGNLYDEAVQAGRPHLPGARLRSQVIDDARKAILSLVEPDAEPAPARDPDFECPTTGRSDCNRLGRRMETDPVTQVVASIPVCQEWRTDCIPLKCPLGL